MVKAFIEEGKFPEHLKQAHVIPIYKKGDNEDPDNYRPISITSSLAKVFEQILREQMNEYLERNNLLGPLQFGFRAKYSTTDALLYATENIRKDLNDNQSTAAALLDLSKAFDSMSHEILLEKLHHLNFDKKAIKMIKSFWLEDTKWLNYPHVAQIGFNYTKVFHKGQFSDHFSSTSTLLTCNNLSWKIMYFNPIC